jgi:predicted amidohydrolase
VSVFGIVGMQLHVPVGGFTADALCRRIEGMAVAFPWVDMVVLSELAAHGPNPARAEPLPGISEQTFATTAKQLGLWIVTGSMYERAGDHVYNTCSVIDPHGAVIRRYRKMFPFRPYSVGVEAGTQFCVFDVPQVGRFAISICYDMWFPETSRTLAAMGAEVILHPVMTPTIDRDVELSIARATAATNQIYVVDVNGVGAGGVGRSLVVGPDGDVLHQAGQAEELFPLELDLSRVARSRERGLHGLGQLLKSFRDAPVEFEVYRRDSTLRTYLSTLGPLVKPGRRSHATPHPDHEER